MNFVYLEGGSGAEKSVPNEMVKMVSSTLSIPIIVGGGIRDSQTAREKVESGASVIITGNFFEDESQWHLVKEFADAIHTKEAIEV
jgi:putative glycerol-1-phosphate prenyltransferase